MKLIKGFHHVAFKAYDFDKSFEFYTKGLGFEPALSWGEGNSRAVMLDTGAGDYIELFAGGTKEPLPAGIYMHVALRTDDCDKALAMALNAGAVLTQEPKDVTLNGSRTTTIRIAFCKGPDGEVLEFFQTK